MFTIEEISNITQAQVVTKTSTEELRIGNGFASDLMSDVLKIDEEDLLLLTGLCNLQTIRTVEMADIKVVLFVRDKKPTTEMITLAEENDIALLVTKYSMFKASGILFKYGLKEVF